MCVYNLNNKNTNYLIQIAAKVMKVTLKSNNNNSNNACNANKSKKIIIDRLYKNNANKWNANPEDVRHGNNQHMLGKQRSKRMNDENSNKYGYGSTANSSHVGEHGIYENVGVSEFEVQDSYGLNRKKSYKCLQVMSRQGTVIKSREQTQQSMLLQSVESGMNMDKQYEQQQQSSQCQQQYVYPTKYSKQQQQLNDLNIRYTIKYAGVGMPQNRQKLFRNLLKQLYRIADNSRPSVNTNTNMVSSITHINNSNSMMDSSCGSSRLMSNNSNSNSNINSNMNGISNSMNILNNSNNNSNNNNTLLLQTAYFVQPAQHINNSKYECIEQIHGQYSQQYSYKQCNNNNRVGQQQYNSYTSINNNNNNSNNSNNNNNNSINNNNNNNNNNNTNINNNMNSKDKDRYCIRRTYRPSPVNINLQNHANAYSLERRIKTEASLIQHNNNNNKDGDVFNFRQRIHSNRYLRAAPRAHTQRARDTEHRQVGGIRRQNSQADLRAVHNNNSVHNNAYNAYNGCAQSSQQKLRVIRQQLHNIYNMRNSTHKNSRSTSNMHMPNNNNNSSKVNAYRVQPNHSNGNNMQEYYRSYLMQNRNNNNANNQNRYRLLIHRDRP